MEGFWLELPAKLCKAFKLSSCPGPAPKPELALALAGVSAKTDAAVVPDVLGIGAAADDMDACSAANGVTAGARASYAPAPTVSSVDAPREMYKGAYVRCTRAHTLPPLCPFCPPVQPFASTRAAALLGDSSTIFQGLGYEAALSR